MTHIHVGERQASSPATDFSAIYHKEWMHYKGWFAKSTDSVSLEISWFSMRHWKCRRVNACPCQPEKTADISRRHHWFLHVRWRLRNWVVILIGRTAREVFFSQSEALPRSVINMEFLQSFLRRHFAGKPVVVSRNVEGPCMLFTCLA